MAFKPKNSRPIYNDKNRDYNAKDMGRNGKIKQKLGYRVGEGFKSIAFKDRADTILKLDEEKIRIERAKKQVEMRRKGGNSEAYTNTLRFDCPHTFGAGHLTPS